MQTDVSVTSAMEITNHGTGPALTVNQEGTQPVIDVQDDGTSVSVSYTHLRAHET